MAFGNERQYAGNDGYSDDLQKFYRYDSFVPNHKQMKKGDLILLRGTSKFLGLARIVTLSSTSSTKIIKRCPVCSSTGIKLRATMRPLYRCQKGKHEFDSPLKDIVECMAYEANYGPTYVSAPDAVSLDEVKGAVLRLSDQLSIQELDMEFAKKIFGMTAAPIVDISKTQGSLISQIIISADSTSIDDLGEIPLNTYSTSIISRPDRDSSIVKALKREALNKCVVCGLQIHLGNGNLYSEVHHLRPIGREHGGPDVKSNLLVLCPNHHIEFDHGAIAIDPFSRRFIHINPESSFHNSAGQYSIAYVDTQFINYHLENIFGEPITRKC